MSARIPGGFPSGNRESRGPAPEGPSGSGGATTGGPSGRATTTRQRGENKVRPDRGHLLRLDRAELGQTACNGGLGCNRTRLDPVTTRGGGVSGRAKLDRAGRQHLRTIGSPGAKRANAARSSDPRWRERASGWCTAATREGAGRCPGALRWDMNAAVASTNARGGPWFPGVRRVGRSRAETGCGAPSCASSIETSACSTMLWLPASTMRSAASAAAADEPRSLPAPASPEPRAASAASGRPRPSLAPRRTSMGTAGADDGQGRANASRAPGGATVRERPGRASSRP
jgi:hypothetical protein